MNRRNNPASARLRNDELRSSRGRMPSVDGRRKRDSSQAHEIWERQLSSHEKAKTATRPFVWSEELGRNQRIWNQKIREWRTAGGMILQYVASTELIANTRDSTGTVKTKPKESSGNNNSSDHLICSGESKTSNLFNREGLWNAVSVRIRQKETAK
ncbi:hypothetical protein C8R44DRAFT_750460 [Mycena epipterygia]|nr:hypothetical protein C8R44DRAFT_750460 [Mycena epipterygia]